ncbi:MAG: 3-methyl-2-oxobutanoate dehydrogenase subunit VorB [Candidatus Gastranaerophilales bacterium]|nr:3-methyl-2-oxobutanoate dehydrogenase subunit VorB [Candidatus Gastranaerophilales bacterium]
MTQKVLMKGNKAIAQAAINAGLQCYFGYPITPQNEIGEFMSDEMPRLGRTYISAESELAAVNMLIGAAATGTVSMTSSSSCAIALMQEAISAMATAEIPGVIISVMRAGPGLGNITPSQGDYFQATKGGGNGDYRTIVLAPSSINEAVELTYKTFYLAFKYRNPAMLLADGMIGQMMEPVELKPFTLEIPDSSDWEADGVGEGANKRPFRKLVSLHMQGDDLPRLNDKLQHKYALIQENEVMYEEFMADDAEILITAFGTVGRVAKSVVSKARTLGIKAGLFRPVTVWPFPSEQLKKAAQGKKAILDIELNEGQMLLDVKAAIEGACPVELLSKLGGEIVKECEILEKLNELAGRAELLKGGV